MSVSEYMSASEKYHKWLKTVMNDVNGDIRTYNIEVKNRIDAMGYDNTKESFWEFVTRTM